MLSSSNIIQYVQQKDSRVSSIQFATIKAVDWIKTKELIKKG